MRVELAYGTTGLPVDLPELPDQGITVLAPRHAPPLPNEPAAIRAALRAPIGSPPLQDLARALGPRGTVAIAFSDGTRAQPRDRILPVLLEELAGAGVAADRITLFNATGTHRANTEAELAEMLGPVFGAGYRIIQHDATDESALADLGTTTLGRPALVNAEFLRADARILTGFIEPHLFAGFTGGPKAVMPGLAGLRTVMGNHGAAMLDDPRATWGVTEGNPIWEEMLEVALQARPTFLLDVALDRARSITGVFAGDLRQAHAAGTRFVGSTALVDAGPEPFDVVLTSNSGYPLDRNLYQAVKGISAAARIVKPGGAIVIASECRDGVPAGGRDGAEGGFAALLAGSSGPEDLLARVRAPGFAHPDQWQAQVLAQARLKAEVHVFAAGLDAAWSSRPGGAGAGLSAHLTACASVERTAGALLASRGPDARLCVLPDGPLTIPTLAGR